MIFSTYVPPFGIFRHVLTTPILGMLGLAPLPRGHSQPLSMTGPPFDTWVPPLVVSEASAPPKDPDFQEH